VCGRDSRRSGPRPLRERAAPTDLPSHVFVAVSSLAYISSVVSSPDRTPDPGEARRSPANSPDPLAPQITSARGVSPIAHDTSPAASTGRSAAARPIATTPSERGEEGHPVDEEIGRHRHAERGEVDHEPGAEPDHDTEERRARVRIGCLRDDERRNPDRDDQVQRASDEFWSDPGYAASSATPATRTPTMRAASAVPRTAASACRTASRWVRRASSTAAARVRRRSSAPPPSIATDAGSITETQPSLQPPSMPRYSRLTSASTAP